MTAANGPSSGDERDVLAYVSASLAEALTAIDGARAAVGTSLVWTNIAQQRRSDEGGEQNTD